MSRILLLLCLATLTRFAVADEVRIPSGVDGLRLYLRHQAPARPSRAAPVLIVHGATFPSANAAAWKIDGRSWMDEFDAAGFDVYALDFLGYGESDRYPAMTSDDAAGAPLVGIEAMVEQLDRAVEHVRAQAGRPRVDVVAHSAGTLVAARYAQLHGDKVERLVLFGTPGPGEPDASAQPEAVRWFASTHDAQLGGYEAKVRSAKRLDLAMFESWWRTYLASDPPGAQRQPPSVRVPSGLSAAIGDIARTGRLPYEPEKIDRPTLVIQGEWDAVTPPAEGLRVFERLASPLKRYVIVSRAGHRAHLEASRMQLFREIETFLAGNDDDR